MKLGLVVLLQRLISLLKAFLDEDFDLVVLVEAPGRVLALLPGVLGEHRGNRDSTRSYNTI